jgi:hypothetical protein
MYKNFPLLLSKGFTTDDAFVGGVISPQPAINYGLLHSPVRDLSIVMLGSMVFNIHF